MSLEQEGFIQPLAGLSHRERQATLKRAWVEHLFIDVGNDLPADIGVNFTVLSKFHVETKAGANTLALVAATGFTGGMYTIYEIEITKAGAMATAEFKWRKKTYEGDTWSAYTTGVVTAADNDLGNGLKVNFTGITSVLGDRYHVHAHCSWHTPIAGERSYLTSMHVRIFDAAKAAKAGHVQLWCGDYDVLGILASEHIPHQWHTPFYLLGDGTVQFKVQFAEVIAADIEYVYLMMKGWCG